MESEREQGFGELTEELLHQARDVKRVSRLDKVTAVLYTLLQNTV